MIENNKKKIISVVGSSTEKVTSRSFLEVFLYALVTSLFFVFFLINLVPIVYLEEFQC